MSQKVWLVTGCSSGLGRELVQGILARGDKAIATARNVADVQDLVDRGAHALELDITASEQILKQKLDEAIRVFSQVDVLVHNAGAFQMGCWEDLTPNLLQNQFNTNVFGPVNLTRAMLPHFRERKDGTILFIGSTSAWMAYAGVSAYGGSKAALERMADGLAREVGPFGIKVLTINAGGFGSELVKKAPNFRPPGQHYEQLMDMIEQSFQWLLETPPGDTAQFANLIIDLVKSEGVAEGRTVPLRFPKAPNDIFREWADAPIDEIPLQLPAGTDAIELIKARCEAMLKVIDQWEGVIVSTDIERKD